MNTPRRILLIEPLAGPGPAPALAAALQRAGAQVRRVSLPGQADAVLDAIEQGWMPVALKSPACDDEAAAHAKSAAATGQPSPARALATPDSEDTP